MGAEIVKLKSVGCGGGMEPVAVVGALGKPAFTVAHYRVGVEIFDTGFVGNL